MVFFFRVRMRRSRGVVRIGDEKELEKGKE